jgi:hypothetical protein
MRAGRAEAFAEIERLGGAARGIAIHGDQEDLKTWKAEGALQFWRVAYAAIYRERLAIKDQEAAFVGGAGTPSGLPGITPREVAHTIANAQYYREMGWDKKAAGVEDGGEQ